LLNKGLEVVDKADKENQYDWKKDMEKNPLGTKRVERFIDLYNEKHSKALESVSQSNVSFLSNSSVALSSPIKSKRDRKKSIKIEDAEPLAAHKILRRKRMAEDKNIGINYDEEMTA